MALQYNTTLDVEHIIERSFKYETIMEINPAHKVIMTDANSLTELNVENWKFNRPADKKRVTKIATYHRNKTFIEGIIYVALIDGNYYCYDGLHRLEAVRILKDSCYYGSQKVIIDLWVNPTDGEVLDRFKALNSSVPVAEIYTQGDKELDLKKTLEGVVEYMQQKYRGFFKPTHRPNIPHENQDVVMQKLYDMYELNPGLEYYNIEEWIEYLMKFNEYYKTHIHKYRLSQRQKAKCATNDFFLFITKDWHMLVLDC